MTTPKFLTEEHLADMSMSMLTDVGQWKNQPYGKCALCPIKINFPCYCNECYCFMCPDCYREHLMDFAPAFDVVRLSDGKMHQIDLR